MAGETTAAKAVNYAVQGEIKKEAAGGNLAAQSLGNPANPGLNAKARGIRGGVHYTPDTPTPTPTPQRHKGGPISKDGAYLLKAGEHVLTAGEADKARKHALMVSGMQSLAKPGKKK